jgi:hypothetical protein
MTRSVIDRVRQPEYTGENRCMACTAVNAVLAVAFAGVVAGGAAVAGGDTTVAAAAGVGFLGLAAGSIWLRGYLVPGTPELTKRYMPTWLLAWFGKAPADANDLTSGGLGDSAAAASPGAGAPPEDERDDGVVDPSTVEVDPERVLVDAGAVEPCEDVDDLCLAASFRDAWQAEIDDVDDIAVEDALATFGFETDDYELTRHDEAVVLHRGPHRVGQWPSEAALVADVAGARVLAERYPAWSDLEPVGKGRVLNGLRVFLETCPDGSTAAFQEETVESCCSTYDVVTVRCEGSGERLFEQPVDDIEA